MRYLGEQIVDDTYLAQANLFYQSAFVKSIYMRTASGAPGYPAGGGVAGGYPTWTGEWGVYPGILFMFGQMEGSVNPYGGTPNPTPIPTSPPPPPVASSPTCGTEGSICLSSLPFATTPINGYGPVELDMSNGETGSQDGSLLTLNGVVYQKGIGAHAYSEITYNLSSQYSSFLSDVGLDDNMEQYPGCGSITMQVWVDGTKLFDSGTMVNSSGTKNVNVSVSGRSQLKLIVTDAGDGISCDHGDWANARLIPVAVPPPAGPTSLTVTAVP